MGLEALASRTCKVEGWNKEIIKKKELDELRDYVRYNKGELWPIEYRTLYPVNAVFNDTQLKGTYWTNRAWQRRLNTAGMINVKRSSS